MVTIPIVPHVEAAPSAADITMTQGLRQSSTLLDIELQDHIIIGGARYVSLRSAGLGFGASSQPSQLVS